MKWGAITATATTALGIAAGGVALWTQIENTKLFDRLVTKDKARQAAVESLDRTKMECDSSTIQMVSLINSCAEWCEGE